MIVDQLCMLTGGPRIFVGRLNDVTHQGLGITQEDWDNAGFPISLRSNAVRIASVLRQDACVRSKISSCGGNSRGN
jgi:hypothetical protein